MQASVSEENTHTYALRKKSNAIKSNAKGPQNFWSAKFVSAAAS